MGYHLLKRKVFKFFLKTESVGLERKSRGRTFHSLTALKTKARSPSVLKRVFGGSKSKTSDDDLVSLLCCLKCKIFDMYSGPKSLRALYVNNKSLKSIGASIGNQCSSIGVLVMFPVLSYLVIKRAALFKTICNLCIAYFGIPESKLLKLSNLQVIKSTSALKESSSNFFRM